jgi:cytochrome c553
MKLVKKILVGLLGVLILIQFIQPARNKSNELQSTDLTKIFKIPQNVQSILKTACYDCHSNSTNYPWYSKIQPFGWLLANHIKEGKEELNFSEFGSYSKRRQISKMNGIANSLKDGSMPLSSYTMIHKDARLSHQDKALLIEWATKTKDSLRLNK